MSVQLSNANIENSSVGMFLIEVEEEEAAKKRAYIISSYYPISYISLPKTPYCWC